MNKESNHCVSLVFISDENYAMPTSVAITSLKINKSPFVAYDIIVFGLGLSKQSAALLEGLASPCFSVSVKNLEENKDFAIMDNKNLHVSKASLYKFVLPTLLPGHEKILYLDGDILILKDLLSFFNEDISDYYLAAIEDRHAYFYKNKNLQERLCYKHNCYFNSGVMLLNLNKMREDDIPDKLIKYRQNELNDFMDQDAFNVILGNKVKYLHLYYNVQSTIVRYSDIEHINIYYPQTVVTNNNWFENAFIYHYSSNEKPWKYSDCDYVEQWDYYYQISPFYNGKLTRPCCNERKKHRQEYLQQLLNDNGNIPLISVIIPVYNAQKYINTCLSSVLQQQDFELIEVIVIDDGSTDNTSFCINAAARFDPRIKIAYQNNMGCGEARNHGIQLAIAPYILFLDADDTLQSGTVLKDAYESAVHLQLDILVCEACEIDSFGKRVGRLAFCLNHNLIPEKSVFTADDLGNDIIWLSGSVVWAKLYSRSFILTNNLFFLPLTRSEDFYFAERAILLANRIGVLPDKELTSHRKNLDNRDSLEQTKDIEPLVFWEAEKKLYYKLQSEGLLRKAGTAVKYRAVQRILYNLEALNTIEGYLSVYHHLDEMISTLELGAGDFVAEKDRNERCNHLYSVYNQLLSLSSEEYLHGLFIKERDSSQKLQQERLLLLKENAALNTNMRSLEKELQQEKAAMLSLGKELQQEKGKNKQERLLLLKENAALSTSMRSLEKELQQEKTKSKLERDKLYSENITLSTSVILLEKELIGIRASWTYKIGRIITFIPRKARDVIRYFQENGWKRALHSVLENLGLGSDK